MSLVFRIRNVGRGDRIAILPPSANGIETAFLQNIPNHTPSIQKKQRIKIGGGGPIFYFGFVTFVVLCILQGNCDTSGMTQSAYHAKPSQPQQGRMTMKFCGWRPLACLASLALASVVTGAWAGGGARPLDMAEAVATALRDNPQVQAARHQLDATEAQVTQARSGLLPHLDVSETFDRTNSPLWAFGTRLNQGAIQAADFDPQRLNDPDAINNFKTALTLTWNLFDGGQSWIGWRQAQKNQEAGLLALRRTEQEVIAQAARAYMGCLLAYENRDVVAQALDTARAHLKVVEDRERSGLAVKSDVLRARVRIADLEQQRLQAESQVQVALALLGAAMGRPEGLYGTVTLTTRLYPGEPVQGDLAQWVQRALDQRPDLQQLHIQEEVARRQVARTRAGHYPTLAVQGNYEINSESFSDSKESYAVGAVVRVNLYSGQRISAQTAEARALMARIRAMREGLALGVRVDTQRAFYQAQSAWQSIEVARTAVDQAEEALRIVANRYESGLLTLVSLLDAQVALQQAQTQHFRALHDYNVARYMLALAVGE
jgi:outer membrane protein